MTRARASLELALYDCGLGLARHLCGLAPHTLEVDGTRIAYLERPGSGPTVVLLHGFAANKDIWLRFAWHLPAGYRVLIPDLPGHGDSDFEPTRRYDAQSITDALERAFVGLGLERYHLAGTSLGGLVATLHAAAHPERVPTLGLFDPLGVHPPAPSEVQGLLREGANPLLVDSRADFDRLMEFVFHQRPSLPWPLGPAVAQLRIRRADADRRIWEDMYQNLESAEPLLPRLGMPVLLVWGAQDRVLHVSSVAVYERLVPDLDTLVLEDCGHAPIAERPRRSARAYADFLAASARRARPAPPGRPAEDARARRQ